MKRANRFMSRTGLALIEREEAEAPDTSSLRAHLVELESLERLNILGPTIQFVTGPAEEGAPCIMRGTIPAGVAVPLHSHADPETFLPLSGTVQGLIYPDEDFSWVEIGPGDIFHVPAGARHAFRNTGDDEAMMIIISTSKIGRFFQEVGVPTVSGAPLSGPPSADHIRRFVETSARYGYWNATADENARVGIELPVVPASGEAQAIPRSAWRMRQTGRSLLAGSR